MKRLTGTCSCGCGKEVYARGFALRCYERRSRAGVFRTLWNDRSLESTEAPLPLPPIVPFREVALQLAAED